MGILRSIAKKVLGSASAAPAAAPAPAASHAPAASPAPAASHAPAASPQRADATEKPWYLDGTNDGWDTTDVAPDGGPPKA